jgi:site-specific DNA recombinase
LSELSQSGEVQRLTPRDGVDNGYAFEVTGCQPPAAGRPSRAYLHTILTNPFYVGTFQWGGNLYRGTHPCFIEVDLHERVQAVLRGHNKPKYRKQGFAFRGLLHCAQDHCAITAERKKEKYVYYRCTGYRGKCSTPRYTEPEMAEKLGVILKGIQIPDHVLMGLQESMGRDQEQAQTVITAQRNALQPRLTAVRRRMDQAYQDKLDGKISEGFWERWPSGRGRNAAFRMLLLVWTSRPTIDC